MRFSPEFLDELKARLPVSGGGGAAASKLKKIGARMEGALALQQGKDALVLRQ